MIHRRIPRVFALALLSIAVAAGCASTRTQKSAGEQVDDAMITASVKAELIGDPLTKARDIDVEVFKGRVQLIGFVDSENERQRAVQIARGVDGVVAVDNNLKLKGETRSTGETMDDGMITSKVKAALAADDRTKAYQVSVETRDAVVLLGGFVNNAAARDAAGAVARAVDGVARVDNQLVVK